MAPLLAPALGTGRLLAPSTVPELLTLESETTLASLAEYLLKKLWWARPPKVEIAEASAAEVVAMMEEKQVMVQKLPPVKMVIPKKRTASLLAFLVGWPGKLEIELSLPPKVSRNALEPGPFVCSISASRVDAALPNSLRLKMLPVLLFAFSVASVRSE